MYCVSWCHYADAVVDKWLSGKCTLYKQDMKNFSDDNVFLKITTFLWIILMLHLGHTSLFLETVMIKFMDPKGRGATYRSEGQGPRKTNTRFFILNVKYQLY